MKKIGTVNLCGIDYDVEERSEEEDLRLENCYGYTANLKSLIVIRKGLAPSVFRNVVFHEIQHGIWEHSGLNELAVSRENYQEAFIQVFTPHLVAAIASMRKWKVR